MDVLYLDIKYHDEALFMDRLVKKISYMLLRMPEHALLYI